MSSRGVVQSMRRFESACRSRILATESTPARQQPYQPQCVRQERRAFSPNHNSGRPASLSVTQKPPHSRGSWADNNYGGSFSLGGSTHIFGTEDVEADE